MRRIKIPFIVISEVTEKFMEHEINIGILDCMIAAFSMASPECLDLLTFYSKLIPRRRLPSGRLRFDVNEVLAAFKRNLEIRENLIIVKKMKI